MTQKYCNSEDNPIETIFLFPMDIDVAISKICVDFKLQDGTTKSLETIIDERKKLEVRYEDAVASGKTAVLGTLSKTQRDMMKI